MNEDYYLTKERFDELRSFIKGWGKAGSSEMIILEPIPGTGQPRLNIIRYIVNTGKVDDYGKQITDKRFVIIEDYTGGRCETVYNNMAYNLGGNISLTAVSFAYEFIPVDSVETYYKEKYYDDILMKLMKLGALDDEHEEEREMMIMMIKEITKK